MFILLFFLASPVHATVAEVPCPTTLQAKASVIVGDLDGYQTDTNKTVTDTGDRVTDFTASDSIFP